MPPAKKERIYITIERPLKKRLEAQCELRGYTSSALVVRAIDAYLTHLEHIPTIDEQILRFVNEVRTEREKDDE